MKTRIITGVLAAGFLTALILKGPFWLMTTVVIACGVLCYLEYDRLFFPAASRRRQIRLAVLIALAVITLREGPGQAWVFLWGPFVLLAIRHVFRANQEANFEASVRDLSLEVLGFIYVVSLLGFLVPIAQWGDHGREYLFLLFFSVFIGDTAAYFVGVRFGKHRLAEKLSPKKSTEGAIGALVATLLGSVFWMYCIYSGELTQSFMLKILIFAPILSALAQIGDLFESLLKRSRAQKDSGTFLPGHGGILDRLDSLALTTPVFYFFVIFILERRT